MKEVNYGEFHIPLVYIGKKSGSNAHLVIIDIKGKEVIWGYRSDETCRVGMLKRSRLEIGRNGKRCFLVRGKRVQIPTTYGWVI